MKNEFLKKRRRGWYVRVSVPKSAQAAYGKTEVTRTLETRDEDEANIRKFEVIGEIRREIADAVKATESNSHNDPSNPVWLERHLLGELESFTNGRIDSDTYQLHQQLLIERHLKAAGVSERPNPKEAWETGAVQPEVERVKEARAIRAIAKVRPGALALSAAVEAYCNVLDEGDYRPATVAGKRKLFAKLVAYTNDCDVRELDRATIVGFLDEVLEPHKRARATVKKDLTTLSTLYRRYLVPRGHATSYEGAGLIDSLTSEPRGKAKSRRAWTPAELIDFTKGAHGRDTHRDVLMAALLLVWTGMRRGELVRLQVADCDTKTWNIKVTEGKNEAALRDLPVHPQIQPLVKHLVETSTDGYLLPMPRKADDIEDAFGKRYGWLRKKLGVDASGINMHTLRNNFIQGLVNAGVPQHINGAIVGHTLTDMTFTYAPANTQDREMVAGHVSRVSHGDFDKVSAEIITKLVG